MDLFQIAFTYYVIGDYKKGRELAEKAIKFASERGRKDLEAMFLKEFEYLESQIQKGNTKGHTLSKFSVTWTPIDWSLMRFKVRCG